MNETPAEAGVAYRHWRATPFAHSCPWLVVVLLLACAGCRQEPTTVSGLVTLDGRPLAMRDGMRGTVVFRPANGEGAILSGLIDSNGKYQLAMGSTKSVASGNYLVSVSAVEVVPPSEGQQEPSGKQITPPRYASPIDSGLRCEIVPGPNRVDLKLASEVESVPEPTPPDASSEDQNQEDKQAEEKPSEAE
jgi:hypothetical protein